MTISPENTFQIQEVQEKIEPVIAQAQEGQNQAAQQEENPEDPNWRAFREGRKQDRIAREAAEKKAAEKQEEVAALKAAMEAAFAKEAPQQQQRQQYDAYADETEDERIEKKVTAALAAREAQSERMRLENEQREYPQRLQQHFPDFQQTISNENLDYLDYHYPEVSRPLQRLGDGYDKWHDIYKAVKKFVPNNQTAKKEAARADNNFNKPKSMSSQSVTPEAGQRQSWQDIEQRRAARWEEMQKIRKGIS